MTEPTNALGFERPLALAGARILVTNDDGIGAPGLAALERIARSLSDDVWVVAPEQEQSAASHSLTIHRPLRLRQIGPCRYAIDGTPTDCVLLAINHVLAQHKPDLVLSGINAGSNIGEDVTYSGTIAAAMEATLLGVPAVALSQHAEDRAELSFAVAEHWGAQVLRQVVAAGWPQNILINLNFPDCLPEQVTGVRVLRHGKRKIGDQICRRLDPRGRPYFWIGASRRLEDGATDTDVAAIAGNAISLTPLDLDLTHGATLEHLQRALG